MYRMIFLKSDLWKYGNVLMDNIDTVLDRMVDNLIAHNEIDFLEDVQYLWRTGWSISTVIDPCDRIPLRYALKACVLERLAEIWSAPPRNRETSPPGWCESVAAVKVNFSVVSEEYRAMWDGDLESPIFSKRNIFAPKEFMFFL